ncbi:MAG: hypothetical protein RIF41_00320, partial [Polyangiaceae bacterium]
MSARRVPRSAHRKPRRNPRATSSTERRPTRKQAAPKPTPRKRPKSGSPARRRKTTPRSTSPSKTTQLSLSGRGTWGGYRAGAGRKRIARDARGYVPLTRRPKVTKSTPVH